MGTLMPVTTGLPMGLIGSMRPQSIASCLVEDAGASLAAHSRSWFGSCEKLTSSLSITPGPLGRTEGIRLQRIRVSAASPSPSHRNLH